MEITNGDKIIALVIVLLFIDFVAVALRFVSRNMRRQKWGLDDWLATLSLIPIAALAGLLTYACASHSLAKETQHDAEGNPIADASFARGAKLGFAFQLLESPTLALLKGSVLLCYRRIFDTPKFKFINNVLLGILVPWTIAAFCLNLFNCGGKYIDSNWSTDFEYVGEHCAKLYIPLSIYVVSDVVFDLIIFIQPIPMVMRLQMPIKVKFAIVATFFLGSLTLVFAVLRMTIYLQSFFGSITSSWNIFADELQFYTIANVFSYMEISLGCLAACLPTLRPVASKVMPSLNRIFTPRSEQSDDSSPYGVKSVDVNTRKSNIFSTSTKKGNFAVDAASVSSRSRLYREQNHPWTMVGREESGVENIELPPHAR